MTGTSVTGTLRWHPGLVSLPWQCCPQATCWEGPPCSSRQGKQEVLLFFHKRRKIRENLHFCLWCNSGPATPLLRSLLGACNTFFLL